MVQEIFIVEDEEELINDLKPLFKTNKDMVLKSMPSRYIK